MWSPFPITSGFRVQIKFALLRSFFPEQLDDFKCCVKVGESCLLLIKLPEDCRHWFQTERLVRSILFRVQVGIQKSTLQLVPSDCIPSPIVFSRRPRWDRMTLLVSFPKTTEQKQESRSRATLNIHKPLLWNLWSIKLVSHNFIDTYTWLPTESFCTYYSMNNRELLIPCRMEMQGQKRGIKWFHQKN